MSTSDLTSNGQRESNDAGTAIARDVRLGLAAGFLFGSLSIPILINLGIDVKLPLAALPIVAAAFFAMAILTAHRLTRRATALFQFAKFAAIGALNSSVDFGVLNFLMLMTGIVSGGEFLALKSVSVALAVTNSYLWNKFWTFEAPKAPDSRRELGAFLAVTLAGIALNVGAAHVIVNLVGAPSDISAKVWANVGALSAAGFTLFTNFFGYKFFVFRGPGDSSGSVAAS